MRCLQLHTTNIYYNCPSNLKCFKHLAIMFEASYFSFTCIFVAQISLPNETMHFFDLAHLFNSMLFIEECIYTTPVNGLNVKHHMERIHD